MVLADLIFTLLNFALFVAVIVWLVRGYRGSIHLEIVQEKQQHEDLLEARSELQKRLVDVKAYWSTQEQEGKLLTKNVALWAKKFKEHRLKAKELQSAYCKELVARQSKQIILRQQQRAQAHIVPHAVAQARLELYKHFHGDYEGADRGKRYIDKSITNITGV